MRWTTVVLVSGVLGVGAAMSDVLALGSSAGVWRCAAVVLNAGVVWAGLAVVCGAVVARAVPAALAGAVGLAVAVLGYYGYAVLLGDRASVGVSAVSGSIRFWLVAAVILGSVLGWLGATLRRTDGWAVLAATVLPTGAAVEVLGLRHLRVADFGNDRGGPRARRAWSREPVWSGWSRSCGGACVPTRETPPGPAAVRPARRRPPPEPAGTARPRGTRAPASSRSRSGRGSRGSADRRTGTRPGR